MAVFSIHGDIIWSERFGSFKTAENGYLTVVDGKIDSVSAEKPACEVIDARGSLVIPGLSDLHLHAPQYAFCGLYMDEELLDWLNNHTFPEEGKYGNMEYADRAYSKFVRDLLKGPDTRVSVFATIHRESSLMLMRKLEEVGFSGYVGKVNMDRNSPPYLTEKTEASLSETERFIEDAEVFREIRPIVTPRFIPSCTDELMKGLAAIAEKYSLPLQSHLDENLSEIEWVRELCPSSISYADAYDRFGMLSSKSIMAHCVYLDDDEIALMAKRGAFVAHAPSSNANLSSGIAPVRKYLDAGLNVGLASDVSGGSSLSMFRIIQDAIAVSKLLWRLKEGSGKPLTFAEAFYLATKGGGSFFGKTGSFEPGYDADIVILSDEENASVLRPELSVEERLEYYVYADSERPVKAKYIKGRKVFQEA